MRHFQENAETFEAQANIDCCYYMLNETLKGLSKPKTPIEIMIDDATGFSKSMTEKARLGAIGLLKQIIENKKFMKADYAADVETLKEIQALVIE